MHFLILDTRFAAAVHVFLEHDPRADPGFPSGLTVRRVSLDPDGQAGDGWAAYGIGPAAAVGESPSHRGRFRVFGSDGAAAGAGFGVVEPRFVGGSWAAYEKVFRPGADSRTGCQAAVSPAHLGPARRVTRSRV